MQAFGLLRQEPQSVIGFVRREYREIVGYLFMLAALGGALFLWPFAGVISGAFMVVAGISFLGDFIVGDADISYSVRDARGYGAGIAALCVANIYSFMHLTIVPASWHPFLLVPILSMATIMVYLACLVTNRWPRSWLLGGVTLYLVAFGVSILYVQLWLLNVIH